MDLRGCVYVSGGGLPGSFDEDLEIRGKGSELICWPVVKPIWKMDYKYIFYIGDSRPRLSESSKWSRLNRQEENSDNLKQTKLI